jgi:hypothetical protein
MHAACGNDDLLLSSPVTVAGPLRVLTAFRSSDTVNLISFLSYIPVGVKCFQRKI